MAELVTFTVPTESDKTLLVWRLSAGAEAEALRRSLSTAFSRFGPLYSVRVFPNAAAARPGFHAVLKFYSARDARRAQAACDGRRVCQPAAAKVRLGTRHKAFQHQTFALNSSRCQELANYYFGFNGWSKRIVKLQEVSSPEKEGLAVAAGKPSLKFFCAVEVVLPRYECTSPGVGIAEEPLSELEEGRASFLMRRKKAQRLAVQRALSDAFQKLSIVVLGTNYSRGVEVPLVSHVKNLLNFGPPQPYIHIQRKKQMDDAARLIISCSRGRLNIVMLLTSVKVPIEVYHANVNESGKIAVEYRPSDETCSARSEEELHDLVQVSSFPWNQPCQREEEDLSDFSLEEEELKLQELD